MVIKRAELTDVDAMLKAGLSPLSASFYAARNAVINERNEKIAAADKQCRANLASLRKRYDAERAAQGD